MALEVQASYDEKEKYWLIIPSGEVDIYTSTTFKEKLQLSYQDEVSDVHIDAQNLEYIDSTGLGILIGALKRLKQKDKNIYIKNLKPNVKKLFQITGLDKIFVLEG